jgi:hypothetical protein
MANARKTKRIAKRMGTLAGKKLAAAAKGNIKKVKRIQKRAKRVIARYKK